MGTITAPAVRVTPDVVGYVRASATALVVFAIALSLTTGESWEMVPLVAVMTVIYGLLPATLLGALTAVTLEITARWTSSVGVQTLLAAVVGGAGTLALLPDAPDVAVLVALSAAIGRLSLVGRGRAGL